MKMCTRFATSQKLPSCPLDSGIPTDFKFEAGWAPKYGMLLKYDKLKCELGKVTATITPKTDFLKVHSSGKYEIKFPKTQKPAKFTVQLAYIASDGKQYKKTINIIV